MLLKHKKTMKQSFIPTLLTLLLLISCNKEKNASNSWMRENDVRVSIDETFRPIMDNLVQTFGMANPESEMKPVYVSEDSALKMIVNDSIRCCIATRKLKKEEIDVIQSHTLTASQALIATDAIALIVNKACNDTLITLDEIKDIVSGKITRWEQLKHSKQRGELRLVFDHSGSSTVRYMRDSLCNGAQLSGNVYASEQGTNQSVIEMVQASTDLIGVVGTNWLKEEGNAPLSDFSGLNVGVMRVAKNEDSKYVRPFQYYIATGDYPLLRSVYIILTDPRSKSLVKSFYFFAKGQKGQTIICNNSQLLPITPVQVKKVSVK